MFNRKVTGLAAWTSLLIVAGAALVPIEFRPTSLLSPNIERFVAFAVVGLGFALAYPRQFWPVALLVIGAAFLFEALQFFAPSRHGRLPDALFKALGASAGLMLGRSVSRLPSRSKDSPDRDSG